MLSDKVTAWMVAIAVAVTAVCSLAIVSRVDAGGQHQISTALPYVNHADGVSDPMGNRYQPCAHEYGQGPAGTYPCLWDADTMGNGQRGAHSPRYIVWARAEDGCPIVADDVERCVYASEWSADQGD